MCKLHLLGGRHHNSRICSARNCFTLSCVVVFDIEQVLLTVCNVDVGNGNVTQCYGELSLSVADCQYLH